MNVRFFLSYDAQRTIWALNVINDVTSNDVKSEDKFTRLFYVSVHDANIRF